MHRYSRLKVCTEQRPERFKRDNLTTCIIPQHSPRRSGELLTFTFDRSRTGSCEGGVIVVGQERAEGARGRPALLPTRSAQQHAHLHPYCRRPTEEDGQGRRAPLAAHAGEVPGPARSVAFVTLEPYSSRYTAVFCSRCLWCFEVATLLCRVCSGCYLPVPLFGPSTLSCMSPCCVGLRRARLHSSKTN